MIWKFQINESGETQGWNDNGIQTFRQNILKSLAREIIQNSIDAKQKNGKPVRVTFTLEKLSRDAVPGIDDLTDRILAIKNGDALNEGEAHKSEIEEACACVEKSTINMMIISDENTEGMPYYGEDTGSPLFRYIKAVGSSGGSQDRAGSHGLGKAAPLATSPLRTIYVSTMWDDEGKINKRYQGRTRLMSLTTDDGISSGTGFWGDENFQPLKHIENESFAWLDRNVAGSTVAIPGFRTKVKEWSAILAGYIVSEFFVALHNKTLEVVVSDNVRKGKNQTFELNAATIKNKNKFFNSAFIKSEIQNYLAKTDEALSDAEYFYQCLNEDQDLITEKFKIDNLGTVRLRFKILEGAPRKICLIRRDMKITDKLQSRGGMWAPGRVPPKIKDFCGLVDILSEEGERFIRLMEPPQHDNLSPDNMPEILRDKGNQVYKQLSQKIRSIIEQYATAEVTETRIVSELSEYFYDDTEFDANAPTVTQEQDPNGRVKISLAPIKVQKANPNKPIIVDDGGTDGGAGGSGGSGGGGSSGHGTGTGSGTGGSGNKSAARDKLILKGQRIWKSGSKHRLSFTVEEAFEGTIQVFEVGMVGHEPLKVVKSNVGTVDKAGIITVHPELFHQNKLKLNVEFATSPIGGLTLAASKKQS